MSKCVHCDDLENLNDGIWKITIVRKYRGSYGKIDGLLCHDCLSNALIGYHTGGGMVGNAIKKIKRKV